MVVRGFGSALGPFKAAAEEIDLAAGFHCIVEADDAIAEPARGFQLERSVASPRVDERDSLADEDWNHVNDELVDLAGVEKRSDQASTAHYPDVFASLGPKAFGEETNRLLDVVPARLGRKPSVRKNVVLYSRADARTAMFERKLVRLSSPENGIDRAEERGDAIVALWTGTFEPIDTAIAPRDETISARRDVHDDLPSFPAAHVKIGAS